MSFSRRSYYMLQAQLRQMTQLQTLYLTEMLTLGSGWAYRRGYALSPHSNVVLEDDAHWSLWPATRRSKQMLRWIQDTSIRELAVGCFIQSKRGSDSSFHLALWEISVGRISTLAPRWRWCVGQHIAVIIKGISSLSNCFPNCICSWSLSLTTFLSSLQYCAYAMSLARRLTVIILVLIIIVLSSHLSLSGKPSEKPQAVQANFAHPAPGSDLPRGDLSKRNPPTEEDTRAIRRVEDIVVSGAGTRVEVRSGQLSRRQQRLGERKAEEIDDTHDSLVAKGNAYVLVFPTDYPAQRQYTDHTSLDDYGWETDVPSKAKNNLPADLTKELTAIGLPAQVDPSTLWISLSQSKPFHNDGISHDPTYATHEAMYSPTSGAILTTPSEGPSTTKGTPQSNVPLQSWSDVAWLVWADLCQQHGRHVTSINRFIIYHIDNKIGSQDSIDDVLERTINPKPRGGFWPGTNFDTNSIEGKALLGLPELSSIADFLLMHQKQLGKKKISILKLFQTQNVEGKRFYNILLEVADV